MSEERAKYTTLQKLQFVDAWKASGLTAAKFAKANGISRGQLITNWASGKGLNPQGRPGGWRGSHQRKSESRRRNNSKPKADTSAAERIAAIRAANSAKMRKAMGILEGKP
jgi:hypothetical protein